MTQPDSTTPNEFEQRLEAEQRKAVEYRRAHKPEHIQYYELCAGELSKRVDDYRNNPLDYDDVESIDTGFDHLLAIVKSSWWAVRALDEINDDVLGIAPWYQDADGSYRLVPIRLPRHLSDARGELCRIFKQRWVNDVANDRRPEQQLPCGDSEEADA